LRRSPIPHFATARRPGAEALQRGETGGEISGATTILPPAGREVPNRSDHIEDAGTDPAPDRKRHRPGVIIGRAADVGWE
jgi:hypothetical protein